MSFKRWLCTSLVAVVAVAPAFAGTNDATDAKSTPSANTADAAAVAAAPASPNPNPNPTPVAGNANVTALLGVLVMKGVLAPTEANAIRNAAPNAQFQALVEALSRKGIVSAADLSANANPATQPTAPQRLRLRFQKRSRRPYQVRKPRRKPKPSPSHLCPRGSRARGLP